MYARYRFVQYVAECHYHPFVYVYGVPDGMKLCFTPSGDLFGRIRMGKTWLSSQLSHAVLLLH